LALTLKAKDGYDNAHTAVFSCEGDEGARRAVDGLRAELRDPTFTLATTFEDLVEDCTQFTATEYWANEFRRRYLDLSPVLS
jgi:hypothetical protein